MIVNMGNQEFTNTMVSTLVSVEFLHKPVLIKGARLLPDMSSCFITVVMSCNPRGIERPTFLHVLTRRACLLLWGVGAFLGFSSSPVLFIEVY